jgi:hypothetical protein
MYMGDQGKSLTDLLIRMDSMFKNDGYNHVIYTNFDSNGIPCYMVHNTGQPVHLTNAAVYN